MTNHDDLPDDPDLDDVPPELLELDGKAGAFIRPVYGPDDDLIGLERLEGTVVIAPELLAHARRLKEGFYDDDDPGGPQ